MEERNRDMGPEERVRELEAEAKELRERLREAEEREKDLEETRKAMLYLLEDINESASAVEKAKRELEATFDAISAPLFIHDGEMRIVRCNSAYSRAAGMDFDRIVGRPYYEVFPIMDGPFGVCVSGVTGDLGEAGGEGRFEHRGRVYRLRFYPVAKKGEEEEDKGGTSSRSTSWRT